MLDSVIRDWLEPSPLRPLRAMSGNMWPLNLIQICSMAILASIVVCFLKENVSKVAT